MNKNAQKRSLVNKYLNEMTDISGIAMEKLFDTEFQKVMENIREKDARIRSIAIGKSYENGDPGPDPISLKDLLKSAKSNFNKREYMVAIDELGRFHTKLMSIVNIAKGLNPIDQDEEDKKTHREFLLKDLDEERRGRLSNLGERFASTEEKLFAQAGLADFFASLPGSRSRALAAYEKRFPDQIKQLRTDTKNLLATSETVFSRLLNALREMDSARSNRSPVGYRKAALKIANEFAPYHAAFENFYKSHVREIKDLLAKKPETQKVPAAPIQHSTQFGDSEVASGFKPAVVGVPGPNDPSGIDAQTLPPSPAGPTEPPTDTADTEPSPPPDIPVEQMYKNVQTPGALYQTVPSIPRTQTILGLSPPPPVQPIKPTAHSKFYEELMSLSNEHPLILASYIKKYALSIQGSDPETSIQLFNIVRSIKE